MALEKCGKNGRVVFLNQTCHIKSVMNTTGLENCEIDLKGTLLVNNVLPWMSYLAETCSGDQTSHTGSTILCPLDTRTSPPRGYSVVPSCIFKGMDTAPSMGMAGYGTVSSLGPAITFVNSMPSRYGEHPRLCFRSHQVCSEPDVICLPSFNI